MAKILLSDFKLKLADIHPHVKILSKELSRMNLPHRFKCISCGHRWTAQPHVVVRAKYACPKCANAQRGRDKMIKRGEIEARIKEKHGSHIRLMGQYRGTSIRHRFKCYRCLSTWKVQLGKILRGSGCHNCDLPERLHNRRKGKQGGFKELTIAGVAVRVQGYEPQAIQWLLANRDLRMSDLVLDSSGDVPVIPYRLGRRNRNYYPDMYIPKLNRIVEVKSAYTSGVLTGKEWRKNQEKAKACIAAGYKFTLMIMHANGGRFMLPPDWYKLNRQEMLLKCALLNADFPLDLDQVGYSGYARRSRQ